ncbi:Beige protein-like 1 [Savitreella phatthalungensis]
MASSGIAASSQALPAEDRLHSTAQLKDALDEINADLSEADVNVQSPSSEGFDVCQAHELLKRVSEGDGQAAVLALAAADQLTPAYISLPLESAEGAFVRFSRIPQPFPPQRSGYSTILWFRTSSTSVDVHQNLIALYDRSRTMLVMLYLEQNSGKLILQTATETSVRFNHAFEPNKWYHLVLVHRRPGTLHSSRATLFINGEEVQTLKIAYPKQAEHLPFHASFGQTATEESTMKVSYSNELHIAQVLIVEQELNHELIRLYHSLGPTRGGHYQDFQGEFLTYGASAALNFALEDSGMPTELRARNAENMPESKLVIAFGPFCMSKLQLASLSIEAKESLKKGELREDSVVPNHTRPSCSEGLTVGDFGVLSGLAKRHIQTGFAEGLYRVGGIVRLLQLVDSADNPEALETRLNLLLTAVRVSWRNAGEMERLHGYEILALKLRAVDPTWLTSNVLLMLLHFVGAQDGSIVNPPAYRFLILNFGLWCHAPREVQRARLAQFVALARHERYAKFNNNRLSKMRYVKRFLAALRSETSVEMLSHVISALEALVVLDFSAENIRAIATFIIFTLHQPREAPTRTQESAAGMAVLAMLERLLCDEKFGTERQNRFAATVTYRWCLVLLDIQEARKSALNILLLLLQSQGENFCRKFVIQSNGHLIMASSLAKTWREGLWSRLLEAHAKSVLSGDLDTLVRAMLTDASRSIHQDAEVHPEAAKFISALKHRYQTTDLDSISFLWLVGLLYTTRQTGRTLDSAPPPASDISPASQSPRGTLSPIKTTRRPRGLSLRRASSYFLVDKDQPTELTLPIGEAFAENIVLPGLIDDLVTAAVKSHIRCMLQHESFEWNLTKGITELDSSSRQITLETVIHRMCVELQETLRLQKNLFEGTRIIRNLARWITVISGCLLDGLAPAVTLEVFDTVCMILQVLHSDELKEARSVQLCQQLIRTIRDNIMTVALVKLEQAGRGLPDTRQIHQQLITLLQSWQEVLFSQCEADWSRALWYCLDRQLSDKSSDDRTLVCDLMRCVAHLQPETYEHLLNGVSEETTRITETDNQTYLAWRDLHGDVLTGGLRALCAPAWTSFVRKQNGLSAERLAKMAEPQSDSQRLRLADSQSLLLATEKQRRQVASWLSNITEVELERHRKARQDVLDQDKFMNEAWVKLRHELAQTIQLLEGQVPERDSIWRLDQTECRLQTRPKLRMDTLWFAAKKENVRKAPHQERSIGRRQQSGPVNGLQNEEGEVADDRNRRVARSLEHGDVIRFTHNINRIVGLDAVEGLLVLGERCLYIIDNYLVRPDGEVVDSADDSTAPLHDPVLTALKSQAAKYETAARTRNKHDTRSWQYSQIARAIKRQFLFRNVALELGFKDGRSFLITSDPIERDIIHARLADRNPALEQEQSDLITANSQSSGLASISRFFQDAIGQTPWAQACKAWERRSISNFEYLMVVNTLAGRSFNDLTQYPVFPWVLADYTSAKLDLQNPATFRDLSRNMGSQTVARRQLFQERYNSLAELADPNLRPFHFGTHYSSAMIVCSYLIRVAPYVESYLLLQGGKFDHADRLFYSIEKAWLSASRDTTTDVRELIPEFFYMPEFLLNLNKYEFGVGQSGLRIDNVELPPWAQGSARVFIQKHREALESDHVSARLHGWIDLVFGHKQMGALAVESTNVFHALSYHGAINVDSISDDVDRAAAIGIIHNFGQTPRQVFTRPHQVRGAAVPAALRLEQNFHRLKVESWQRHAIRRRIGKVHLVGGDAVCIPVDEVQLPGLHGIYASFGHTDRSVRFFGPGGRPMGVCEGLHDEAIIGACATRDLLVLASEDATASVWQASVVKGVRITLTPRGRLRGHRAPLTAVQCCADFALIVTAAQDGSVFLWDLNRCQYVRTLQRGGTSESKAVSAPVVATAVNRLNGHIVVASQQEIRVFDVNGFELARSSAGNASLGNITAVDFYQGRGGEFFLPRDIIFTGHEDGVAGIWALKQTRRNEDAIGEENESGSGNQEGAHWQLHLETQLEHKRQKVAITAFATIGRQVVTGNACGDLHTFTWIV